MRLGLQSEELMGSVGMTYASDRNPTPEAALLRDHIRRAARAYV